jgi:hypothetical protein
MEPQERGENRRRRSRTRGSDAAAWMTLGVGRVSTRVGGTTHGRMERTTGIGLSATSTGT